MLLYKILARFNLFTHQNGECLIRDYLVFTLYPLDYAAFRIHRSLPELIRIHFTKSFVSLHGNAAVVFLPFLFAKKLCQIAIIVDIVLYLISLDFEKRLMFYIYVAAIHMGPNVVVK